MLHSVIGMGIISKPAIYLALTLGADVNNRDREGNTPLHNAIKSYNTRAAELLLDYGADYKAKNNDGFTPLQWAVYYCQEKIVERLLKCGADPNIRDEKDGNTPLHYATSNSTQQYNIVKLLLEYGADPNKRNYLRRKNTIMNPGGENHGKETPLACAIYQRYRNTIELLLQYGANPNKENCHWNTSLHVAVVENYSSIISLLLKHDADPNIYDNSGHTPLCRAAACSIGDTLEVLLKSGLDPNIRDKHKRAPLHYAAMKNKKWAIELLLKYKARANVIDYYGDTPLHYIILYSTWPKGKDAYVVFNSMTRVNPLGYQYEIFNDIQKMKLLLDHGADYCITNREGHTFFDIAKSKSMDDIIKTELSQCNFPKNNAKVPEYMNIRGQIKRPAATKERGDKCTGVRRKDIDLYTQKWLEDINNYLHNGKEWIVDEGISVDDTGKFLEESSDDIPIDSFECLEKSNTQYSK